MDFELFVND